MLCDDDAGLQILLCECCHNRKRDEVQSTSLFRIPLKVVDGSDSLLVVQRQSSLSVVPPVLSLKALRRVGHVSDRSGEAKVVFCQGRPYRLDGK